MTRRQIFRILDANFNRSREGLRVCEEIARFVLEDAGLTARLKKLRHAVTARLKDLPGFPAEIIGARDSEEDVGGGASRLEKQRKGALGIFLANAERTKESLRVLEEVSKLIDEKVPAKIKKIRFSVYELEKKALPLLEALRDH